MGTSKFLLELSAQRELRYVLTLAGKMVLGRQLTVNEPLGQVTATKPGETRVAIEAFAEVRVSRKQLELEPRGQMVTVRNPSANPVLLESNEILTTGQERQLAIPTRVKFGPNYVWEVMIAPQIEESAALQSLAHRAPFPGQDEADSSRTLNTPLKLSEAETESLGVWLKAIAEVLHSATRSSDFFALAARRVVTLLGFDSARALLFANGRWQSRGEYCAPTNGSDEDDAAPPSTRLLEQMRGEKRTVWKDATAVGAWDQSQAGFQAIVCSPIRNRAGEVIGALYADRKLDFGKRGQLTITSTEALLIETLAFGIAAGLERLEQEKAVRVERGRFEQFFGPELAQHLEAQPDLLKGKVAKVTILFADIRGFSRISEQLDTTVTMSWIHDTLNTLSSCVQRNHGVIVDYIGDELMAMWGAPLEQREQETLACRCALEMLASLGEVNARWESQIGQRTELGIGVHTGPAQVGNVGSSYKFKYGPLGHNVNLASRVQGVNKYLRTSLLITQATKDKLPADFLSRQVCQVRVVNIVEPVKLYELLPPEDNQGQILCPLYEQALREYEARDFHGAVRMLGRFLPQFKDDGPSHMLLARAVDGLVNPSESFDPAWELMGK